MDSKDGYTFKRFKEELDNGFQIYFTYLNNRYLVYKTANNCYTQEQITFTHKSPHPRISIITLKRLKEIFTSMEDVEYKTGI